MTPVHQLIIDEITALVVQAGGVVEYKTGKKHSFAVIRFGEAMRKVAISNGTKTIKHQVDWARQAARRAIRDFCA